MGHTDICKLLLASGANIEQREQGGRTPLYIAARGSFTAIVDMIIKTARLDYPSHVSCLFYDDDAIYFVRCACINGFVRSETYNEPQINKCQLSMYIFFLT